MKAVNKLLQRKSSSLSHFTQAFPLLTDLLTFSLTKYPNFVFFSSIILYFNATLTLPSNSNFQFYFYSFRPASESEISDSASEISKILMNCSKKQSDSDLIPTWLLK